MSAPSSRNAPCPCGSGRRYKHCHGSVGRDHTLPDTPAPLDAVRALLMQGKLVETVEACETQIAASGADVAMLRVLGEAVALLGDADKTMSTWRAVLEFVPEDPEALFHLGNHALQRDDSDAAIAFFERALVQAPAHNELRNNLGMALEAAGRLVDAEQEFRQAYEINTGFFETMANLAQNLFQQNRFSDALPWFDRLVSRFEVKAPEIWANRAVCQRELHDFEGAAFSFERALETETASMELYLQFGLMNLEMNRFDISSDALERCLELDPANISAKSALLYCRQNMADWRDYDEKRTGLIDIAASIDEQTIGTLNPFAFLTVCDDPALQKNVACAWAQKVDKLTH